MRACGEAAGGAGAGTHGAGKEGGKRRRGRWRGRAGPARRRRGEGGGGGLGRAAVGPAQEEKKRGGGSRAAAGRFGLKEKGGGKVDWVGFWPKPSFQILKGFVFQEFKPRLKFNKIYSKTFRSLTRLTLYFFVKEFSCTKS